MTPAAYCRWHLCFMAPTSQGQGPCVCQNHQKPVAKRRFRHYNAPLVRGRGEIGRRTRLRFWRPRRGGSSHFVRTMNTQGSAQVNAWAGRWLLSFGGGGACRNSAAQSCTQGSRQIGARAADQGTELVAVIEQAAPGGA